MHTFDDPTIVCIMTFSLTSSAPSLEEERSGALPVHELFFSPGFLGNMNIHEIQRASTATDTYTHCPNAYVPSCSRFASYVHRKVVTVV